MTEFAIINYLMRQGWQMVDNQNFMLAGRTEKPVDMDLAFFIQRQREKTLAREIAFKN